MSVDNPVPGPSEISFSDEYPKPKALTEEELLGIDDAFVEATKRCKQVGCKLLMYTVDRQTGC